MYREFIKDFKEIISNYTLFGKILLSLPLLIVQGFLFLIVILMTGVETLIFLFGSMLLKKVAKRIILVGGAASGKDYYRDYLSSQGQRCDISYTTRPKRGGEVEGESYIYVSKATFEVLDFHEKVQFNGWQYGTSKESWENNKVFIMTPSGISQLSKQDRKESIIIYFNIEEKVRKIRLSKRNDSNDSIERRLEADREDFKDFKTYDIEITNPFFKCEEIIKL